MSVLTFAGYMMASGMRRRHTPPIGSRTSALLLYAQMQHVVANAKLVRPEGRQ
jgi:hypothetical protein